MLLLSAVRVAKDLQMRQRGVLSRSTSVPFPKPPAYASRLGRRDAPPEAESPRRLFLDTSVPSSITCLNAHSSPNLHQPGEFLHNGISSTTTGHRPRLFFSISRADIERAHSQIYCGIYCGLRSAAAGEHSRR